MTSLQLTGNHSFKNQIPDFKRPIIRNFLVAFPTSIPPFLVSRDQSTAKNLGWVHRLVWPQYFAAL